jgi:hypothetical protein
MSVFFRNLFLLRFWTFLCMRSSKTLKEYLSEQITKNLPKKKPRGKKRYVVFLFVFGAPCAPRPLALALGSEVRGPKPKPQARAGLIASNHPSSASSTAANCPSGGPPPHPPPIAAAAPRRQSATQGALKTNLTDPHVVGWFLGGQKSTRVGQILCEIFNRVFELPSPRNAQKRDKRNQEKSVLDFLSIFLLKLFDTISLVKRFLSCF